MKPYIAHIMIMGRSILRIGLLLSGIILLSSQEARATHIVGGDLTYRCLGGNMYEVRLTLRRDCLLGAPDAQFDDPASVGFFDATTFAPIMFVGFLGELRIPFNHDDTLNQIFISDCTIAGSDVCVHQTTYVDTLLLPFRPTGYIMAYQRCCRNATINNILDPLNTGMTLIAELSGFAQSQCNSSPSFGDYPPIYICVNEPINFDHSAFDIEGDSLVYCLEAPLAGGDAINNRPQPPPPPPYDLVNFRPPYNIFNLMGGDPLMIDPVTGVLTGNPNTIGQFVVGICVTAYKDGVLTGKTRRDFQYNVRMCRDVPVANFTAPPLNCDNLTVPFTNLSTLADDYLWIFDYPNPGSPTSTEFSPTHTYAMDGFYNVALIVNDSDMICFDTIVRQVGVFTSRPTADFTYNVSSCTDGIVIDVTDQSTSNYPLDKWEWVLTYSGELSGLLGSTEQHPTFSFDIEGPTTVLIVLIVTDVNGCSDSQVKSFQVNEIDLQLNPDATHICNGDSTHLVLNGDPELTYTWSPTIGLDLTNPWDPIAFPSDTTCYFVTVTDGECVVTDSICVEVQQLPDLQFTYETDCKSLLITFTNGSDGVNYHWDFGDPLITTDTSNEVNPVHTYDRPGAYVVTLSSRDGCDVSISQTVTVNIITEEIADTLINCFNTSIELNPDGNPDYIYLWSPAEFLDDPTLPNPTATVDDDTEFCVTITEPGLEGCEIVECVLVIIPDDFEITAPGDITFCDFSEIELTAVLTGNPNVEIVWKDLEGNILGTGPILIVSPQTTETYIVMAMDTLGCIKSDTVTVSRPDPTFSVIATGDTSYCDIQTITLTAVSLPDFGVDLAWFNAAGELIGTGGSVDVTPGSPTCYHVIGTDLLGCQESDTVCLTPTFFNLSITQAEICAGEQATLTVTDHNGDTLTYEWSPTETIISGQGTPVIVVQPGSTTTYSVVVTNVDVNCETTLTSTVTVFVFDPPVIVITADPDSLVIGESSQLEVNQDPGFEYLWSTSTGEVVPPIYNPTVTPMTTTTYTVTVTDENGCTGTASITVSVIDPPCDEESVFLPNAFTPNNDGFNDMLYVRSNYVTSMELVIYNRWGERVFRSININNGWDGTYRGKLLAPDVFGYYLKVGCPGDKTFEKKGNITLLH